MSETRFISKGRVLELFPVSVPTLDRYVRSGTFPAPIKYGQRGVKWIEAEVLAWLEQRKAERAERIEPVRREERAPVSADAG
jgi:prophage regulatory protein